MLQVELLWNLQCIDNELNIIKKCIRNKEAYDHLTAIINEYNRLKELQGADTIELQENVKSCVKYNENIKYLNQKLEDCNKKLYLQGHNLKSIDSLQKEVDAYCKKVNDEEDNLLGVMEKDDEINISIIQREKQLSVLKEQFDDMKKKSKENIEMLKKKQELMENNRKSVLREVDEYLIGQYNELANKKNNPVSPVVNLACTECGVKLNSMLFGILKKGEEICFCEYCGRILYIG